MDDIFWFTRHGKHGFLSNFYRAPIKVKGVIWATTEHYYQAMKSVNPKEQNMIRELATPKEAKFAGYHVSLREGWEEIKEEVMLTGLRAKFQHYPELAKKLLDTGDSILHEDSPWDKYWGYAKGEGKDRLGKLLMKVRDELTQEATIGRDDA